MTKNSGAFITSRWKDCRRDTKGTDKLRAGKQPFGFRLSPGDHDDAALGDEISFPISIGIVTDLCSGRNDIMLVDNGPSNSAASSYLYPVHDHRVLNSAVAVDSDVGPYDATPNHAPADDGAVSCDGIVRFPSAPFLIKDKLCRRIVISCRANRPAPVVEVKGGINGAKIHVCLKVGFNCAHVSPVAGLFPLKYSRDRTQNCNYRFFPYIARFEGICL